MIQIQFKDSITQELVRQAVIRSVSGAQIIANKNVGASPSIFIGDHCPDDRHYQKVIVFGPTPRVSGTPTPLATLSGSGAGLHFTFAEHPLTQNLYLRERFFERYDFAREWNHLGYGRIDPTPGTPWSVASKEVAGATMISVWDEPGRSVLWYNRNVGPIDGFDWRMIEDFISDYRATGVYPLTSLPVLSEIPADCTAAVTFRIDCDENIESGRPLFELYKKRGHPFSLAVKTNQPIEAGSVKLMQEILSAGGSVVSHSHTHACDWGESPDRPGPKSKGAKWEAETSREILGRVLESGGRHFPVRYAVSPFHQNPERSVRGILEGGLEAFVGGIICNDPEYLMARAGFVPFVKGSVSHSQQCMLHGDSYHQAGNSISVYEAALESALKTETFFGYLDHPLSSYQYGWKDEAERLKVHTDFLDLIASKPGLWFASLSDTLDFLWDRAHTSVSIMGDQVQLTRGSSRSLKSLAVRWKGHRLNW